MPGGKQRPKGEKSGPGTGGVGRLSDAPPPEEGTLVGSKQPPYEVTGLDAISPLLEYVAFPASRGQIESRIGHVQVPIDKEHTCAVRDILEKATPNQFQSSGHVEQAIRNVWDQVQVPEGRGRGSHHVQGDDLTGRPRH